MPAQNDSPSATRPSLLALLKDWEQHTAWREFDQDYSPLLRNVARKAGLTEVEADEVAQDTLIAVAKKIGEFQHAGNQGAFRAWLYQQARWRITDQFRKRRKTEKPPDSPAGPDAGTRRGTAGIDESEDPFARLWNSEWIEHLRQVALGRVKRQVSTRQFQLFDLHVLQELPVREAARVAGSTMAAVYMAKSRVSRVLKRELATVRRNQESVNSGR